ncbi:MAG: RNA methyltransferase [Planctomycetes bacterium]|nr:RNA methyltransferase [Planctomycetota bacterium]
MTSGTGDSIADPSDPRLDDYRFLRDRDLSGSRRAEGLLVGETLPIIDIMLRVPGLTRSVLTSPRLAARAAATIAASASPATPHFIAEESTLASLTGFHVHRGALAIGVRSAIERHHCQSDPFRTGSLLVALDEVSNMDNVGSIFRSCAAFGVDGVLLSRNSHDPLYRKAIRVSMGHALTVPFAWCDDLAASLRELRTARPALRILAADAGSSAIPIDDVCAGTHPVALEPNPPPTLLVIGAEFAGVSAAVREEACEAVRIPIAGGVDSLNAGVAAGICLHRLSRIGGKSW